MGVVLEEVGHGGEGPWGEEGLEKGCCEWQQLRGAELEGSCGRGKRRAVWCVWTRMGGQKGKA